MRNIIGTNIQNFLIMPKKTKKCKKCNQEKDISDFYKDKHKKSGYCSQCKNCRKNYYKNLKLKSPEKLKQWQDDWRKNNLEKSHKNTKNGKLKYKYKINDEIFSKLENQQKNLCAVCGLPEIAKTPQGNIRPLSVDHNHNTKQVRGLLCSKCNLALGLLKVDNFGILNLQTAIKYILEAENGKR